MGGDTSNPKQVTKHLHMGGDTLNPNQVIQRPQMGEDTFAKNLLGKRNIVSVPFNSICDSFLVKSVESVEFVKNFFLFNMIFILLICWL